MGFLQRSREFEGVYITGSQLVHFNGLNGGLVPTKRSDSLDSVYGVSLKLAKADVNIDSFLVPNHDIHA